MTGVENKFAELKKAGKKGLIIYITAGIPDADSTVQLVLEACYPKGYEFAPGAGYCQRDSQEVPDSFGGYGLY